MARNGTLTVAAKGVLANDTDVDNDPLTAALSTNPSHGAVTLNANGSFVYTPVSGYTGTDSFSYKASDGSTTSAVATVKITVGTPTFLPTALELAGFGRNAGGWSNATIYPRLLADMNGDHMADIVGFGAAGVYTALATGNGHFSPATFTLANFGADPVGGGWNSNDIYPRLLADVTGDGVADIVGFGDAGVYRASAA